MYSVYWSDSAKQSFDDNLKFLAKTWPNSVTLNFINRVDEIILKISQKPSIFPIYKTTPLIHKCLVHRKITLYYQVNHDKIILLLFWQNSQDIKNLKL